MKIVRYKSGEEARYGIYENGVVYTADGDIYSRFSKGEVVGGIEAVSLLAPCDPKSITSIGANYASRCAENNLSLPDEPGKGDRFLIPVGALTGPGGLIFIPEGESRVEYSGELGIVMRKSCRNVTADEAPDYILGYTVIHNVWAKDPRGSTRSVRERIRAYESFCPTGPWIETEIDPSNIAWETRVNGEVRQKANTSEMLFSCAEIVASVSSWQTLEAGDLIQTGTASGVAPLEPGARVDIEFSGIGVLSNFAVQRSGLAPIDLVWIDDYEGH